MFRKILKSLGIALIVVSVGIAAVYVTSRHRILDALDDAGQIAETAVGPIEYGIVGDSGPVILFAHGTPGGFDQTPFFSAVGFEGYRVLTPSRPGYMATPLDVGRTPQDQARAFAALLDALDIDEVVVLAVSGGGPSAIAFAALYPDRTLALVGLEALSETTDAPLDIPRWMRSDFLFWTGISLATSVGDGKAILGMFDAEDAARIEQSPDGLKRVHDWLRAAWPISKRLTGWRNDSEQFMKLELPISQVRVPTLILNGTEDREAHYADAERLAATIPGARLYTVDGANHAMLMTHKDELSAVITDFLREVL